MLERYNDMVIHGPLLENVGRPVFISKQAMKYINHCHLFHGPQRLQGAFTMRDQWLETVQDVTSISQIKLYSIKQPTENVSYQPGIAKE